MTLQLKNYQQTTLDVLRQYLEAARFKGGKAAYESMTKTGVPEGVHYKPMKGMEKTPFICLRLPTGGGKTLLSAHTVKIAAEAYLETEFPLVLWLVPTNTIRSQTLETLKNPDHANNQALRTAFDGKFMVLDIADFEQIRPQDLKSKACVIVGTIQTLRVESTDGRKVYAHNENLEPHFTKAPTLPDLEHIEDGDNKGKIKFSFSNLLHLHRPLVIVDEAHNASSALSYEVMKRVNAACIIEYTATPAEDSNILHNVSASELKAEEMIKLPIILSEHKTWEDAVKDAIINRERLATIAKDDNQYIRPIVLFQAEKKNQDVTKDILLNYLVEQEKIDRKRIAVVTGDQKELDGINLFDPACPVDFVITIEALKEGWDCSFAYVFCSVANVKSSKDVEQILGRVLRMPYAKRRAHEELNRAYAHVSSTSWPHAVTLLHDRLVDMGFEKQEADAFIEKRPELNLQGGSGGLFEQPVPLVLKVSDIDISALSPEEKSAVSVVKTDDGCKLTISKPIGAETIAKIEKAVPKEDRKNVATELTVYKTAWDKFLSPAQKGETFNVPQLCFWMDDELTLAEKDLFLDANGWNLLEAKSYPPELGDDIFKISEQGKKFQIDINAGKLQEKLLGETDDMQLQLVDTGWTELALSRWLDQRLRQPDVKHETLLEFMRRSVAYLADKRKIPLPTLVYHRYVLAKILAEKIKDYRKKAFSTGYQETLFGKNAAVETSYEYGFAFGAQDYPAHWYYPGHPYEFQKHFYPQIGELENSGEEFECAVALDQQKAVKYWVRNISKGLTSFWLPTSTDKFYPDFVAELTDGRILALEYKGADRISADDAKEKLNLGQLWEEKSKGKALFLMAEKFSGGKNIYQQIENKIK
jgi:type III restriction enzyme